MSDRKKNPSDVDTRWGPASLSGGSWDGRSSLAPKGFDLPPTSDGLGGGTDTPIGRLPEKYQSRALQACALFIDDNDMKEPDFETLNILLTEAEASGDDQSIKALSELMLGQRAGLTARQARQTLAKEQV